MVRFQRRETEKARAAIQSLDKERRKKSGTYNTPEKKVESAHLRESLRKELAQFKGYVRDYLEASGEDKQDLYVLIQRELSARSAFTAFKRWLIWDNEEFFTELVALCE